MSTEYPEAKDLAELDCALREVAGAIRSIERELFEIREGIWSLADVWVRTHKGKDNK